MDEHVEEMEYSFNDENKCLLKELEDYHTACLVIITKIKDVEEVLVGDVVGDISLPKKPKKDLVAFIHSYKNKKIPADLNYDEMHLKLVSKLAPSMKTSDIVLPINNSKLNLFNFLYNHRKLIVQSIAQTFYYHCCYGFYLDEYYKQFKTSNQKLWEKHIKEKFNISPGYSRKLRSVGAMVHNYPKLGHLSLSFKRFYNLKNKIKEMLKKEEIANFWKEVL